MKDYKLDKLVGRDPLPGDGVAFDRINRLFERARNMQHVTQWFSPAEPPVHEGVYERDMSSVHDEDNQLKYSYWCGGTWKCSGSNPDDALFFKTFEFDLDSSYQDLPWRGLVK
jgi:hypothetical protein